MRAAGGRSIQAARRALEELCGTYWSPVYAFIRRRDFSPADAEDLTQAFFVHFLESEFVRAADHDRGRFRSYLLKSVSNFLSADRRTQKAQKRGGGVHIQSLDFESGERQYRKETSDSLTAEQLFERRWAVTLLDYTIAQLRGEYEERDRLPLFEALEAHLNGDDSRIPYAQLCETLQMSEDAVKQAARRIKLRYREILRAQIGETVESPEDVDDELRQLLTALSY